MKPAGWGWIGGGALAVVLLASLAWGLAHPAEQAPASLVGRTAPKLAIQAVDGSKVALADLRGRPVVLNFWASWCPPCREEDPALKSAASASDGRIRFLGVNIQDTAAAASAYVVEQQQPYPVGPLVSGRYQDYGVTVPPETFFIDSDGKVAARFVGPLDVATLDVYIGMLH
jgi:cytochrome c biogenesis protein CcmG, thiol:disulfide interchange protein DsbE